jgi:hypothetical protein
MFQATPFRKSRIARLALTQFLKRSPVNLRPVLLVPKSHNPKGTAVFLSAVVRLRRIGLLASDLEIETLSRRLLADRSDGQPHSCWGYSFDWQQRVKFVPRGTPNIICTTFAGNALLDVQELVGGGRFTDACSSASEFVMSLLHHDNVTGDSWFSYTPLDQSQVHNANLLGAAFLCRVARVTRNESFLLPALDAARFTARRQLADGSWGYGEHNSQKWVDNFHTGFNLCALHRIAGDAKLTEFDDVIRRGLRFYIEHFFDSDGAPHYFHNKTFPIDIHSVAQSIITLLTLKHLDERAEPLASAVLHWAVDHMLDPAGFFYYQKRRCYTVRIPYMRWSQAWMLLALSVLLSEE